MMIAVAASMPMYWFFAWLSDLIGRKIIMFLAIALSAAGFFPCSIRLPRRPTLRSLRRRMRRR